MGAHFSSNLSQAFPPKPRFTEKDLPDLKGKVYIVTGSNTGVGKALAGVLYSKNAKVYVLARSEEKANKAINDIKTAHPRSEGALVFIPLDLNDLSTIKTTASRFLSLETKLHVLFNNAGVMNPTNPPKEGTAQGYEHHLGINTLAPFLLTKLLTPTLVATANAEKAAPGTVRVVWVSSSGTELLAEPSVGIDMDNLDYHVEKWHMYKYGISKTGNWMHSVEFAKRYQADGVISTALNPGNLKSELGRDTGGLLKLVYKFIVYPAINGAYTELFAGLSPQITMEETGSWVAPFGRIFAIREDLVEATKTKEEGGNGTVLNFWEWSEEQVKPYI